MAPHADIHEVFARVSDAGTMRRLFDELFTPAERRTLGLRWRLLEMLNEGKPQRRISETLGVSLCKITRGSRILKQQSSAAREVLAELSAEPSRTRTRR